MKKFWNNPENNPIKIILLVAIIAIAGFFVYQSSHRNALTGKGLVFDPIVPGFSSAISSSSGFSAPTGVATGDFNNDGFADAAFIESSNATINIVLGNGDGTLSPGTAILLPGGSNLISITANIFRTGSSNTDLAVADSTSGEIFVFLGNGDGTFTASTPASFTAGIGASSEITSGNIGSSMSLFAAQIDAGVALGGRAMFLGNGDGTFDSATPVTLSNPSGVFKIGGGDIDNDGDFDLGTVHLATVSSLIHTYLGDGAGVFSPTATPTSITGGGVINGFVFSDFDNDDNLDLAVIGENPGEVSIFPGDGTGVFSSGDAAPAAVPGSNASAIDSADFNNDGMDDLIVTDSVTGNAYVLLNPPLPSITNVTSSTANGSYRAGDTISIQITFDHTVAVTGTPELYLATGGATPTPVSYTSGSGTTTLTFTYTISPADTSADLSYTSGGFSLNGGTIRDTVSGSVNADITLPTPGSAGSLSFNKDLIIDTTPPEIIQITAVPTPTTDTTPSYTFSTTEAGAISYLGSCTSVTTSATLGSNTITFSTLTEGTYSSCQIYVTDLAGNESNILTIQSFTISSPGGGSGGGGGGGIILPPFLSETTPVSTPTTNHNPTYILTATESGNLSYTGGCISSSVFIGAGVNTIVFNTLPSGTYSTCTIQLTNGLGIKSNILNVSSFTIVDPIVTPTIKPTPEPKPTPAPIPKPAPKPKPVPTIVPTLEPLPEPTPPPIVEIPTPTTVEEPIVSIETPPLPITPTQSVVDKDTCVYGNKSGIIATISNEIVWRFCQIKPFITKFIDSTRSVYVEYNGDILLKILVVLSLLVGGIITFVYGIFLDTLSFGELLYIPRRVITLFVKGLGFNKQKQVWGTVYDSITKHPLDPVTLTLWDSAEKKITSTITDITGKYGFGSLPPGTYTITATKHNYTISSNPSNNRDHDEVYRHLYHGESFNVLAPGGPMILNIPMNPNSFNWTEFAKNGPHTMKSYAGSERLFFSLSSFFMTFGFFTAVVLVIGTTSVFNITLLGIALVLYILKPQTLCAQSFGYITDGKSGDPLSFGIVRISSGVTGTDIVDCVLDAVGKYSYPLPKGSYLLRVDRKNFDVGYHTLMKNIPIVTKKNVVAQSLIVTEAT